jgi:hypothetical protein
LNNILILGLFALFSAGLVVCYVFVSATEKNFFEVEWNEILFEMYSRNQCILGQLQITCLCSIFSWIFQVYLLPQFDLSLYEKFSALNEGFIKKIE